MESIGSLIRVERLKTGMSQERLARAIGTTKSAISRYESGKRLPDYDQLNAIAAALGVDWEELVPADARGAMIAAHVIKKAGLTVKDKDGNVIHQGDGKPWGKMSDAAKYRAGFLQFHSEEDRIAHFYRLLNEDGKLAASGCFYRHLDKDTLKEVADFVLNLSENPLYLRHAPTDAPESPPAPQEDTDDTTETEKPPTDATAPADGE